MKRFTLIFGTLAAAVLIIGLVGLAATFSAEPVDDTEVHGISERSSNAILKVAVTEQSRTAYPVVTWYIYTPESADITHTVDGTDRISENVAAGLHTYTEEYEEGNTVLIWNVGDRTYTFSVRITNTSAVMLEDDTGQDTITMFAHELESRINNTVAIAIGCVLVAFPFMTRYWKEKKSEGFEDVIE